VLPIVLRLSQSINAHETSDNALRISTVDSNGFPPLILSSQGSESVDDIYTFGLPMTKTTYIGLGFIYHDTNRFDGLFSPSLFCIVVLVWSRERWVIHAGENGCSVRGRIRDEKAKGGGGKGPKRDREAK